MAWIYLLVFSLVNICIANGDQCTDCTLKPHLPCSITDGSKSLCPGAVEKEGQYPSDPTNLKFTTFYGKQGKYPGVHISWSPPQDGSHKFLEGFRLVFTANKYSWDGWSKCYFYNLSSAEWTDEDKDLQFNYTCRPYVMGIIHIQVFSVPTRDDEYTEAEYYFHAIESIKDHGIISNGAEWTTPIFYRLNCTNHFHVGFNLNQSLDFDEYVVGLNGSDDIIVKHEPSKVDGWAIFPDIGPGAYYVTLVPKGKGCRTHCAKFLYRPFDIIDPPRCDLPTTIFATTTQPLEVTSFEFYTSSGTDGVSSTECDNSTQPDTNTPSTGELSVEKKIGISIGIILAVLISLTLILLVVCRRNNRAYDCTKQLSSVCVKGGGDSGAPLARQMESVNLQNKVCVLNVSKKQIYQEIMHALFAYMKALGIGDVFASSSVREAEKSKLAILMHFDEEVEEKEAVRAIGEIKLLHVYFGFTTLVCVRQISGDKKYCLLNDLKIFMTQFQVPSSPENVYENTALKEYDALKGCIERANQEYYDSGLGDPNSLNLNSVDSDTQLIPAESQSFKTIDLVMKPQPTDDLSLVSPDFKSELGSDSVSYQFHNVNTRSGESQSLGGESV